MSELKYVGPAKFRKYYGEQSEWHDGELIWPGYNGIPALKTNSEGPYTHYTLYSFFHSKIFDLSDPKDHEYYCWVRDRIANNWFLGHRLEIKWEGEKLLAYLEWVQYYVVPVEQGIDR